MNEAEQILIGVAEAHASADSALEVGSGAGHIEGNHALVLVPDVYHAVYLLVGRIYGILCQQLAPIFLQFLKQLVCLLGGIALAHHLESLCLVDNILERLCVAFSVNGVGSDKSLVIAAVVELLSDGHLYITEAEYKLLLLAGRKLDLKVVRSDRRPALRNGHIGLARENSVGALKAVVQTEEALAVGVIALNGSINGVEREVIAALLVFGLVVNGGAEYLDLAGVEVSLEVGGIVVCVPEAPFDKACQLERLLFAALVGDREPLNFAIEILRNEELHLGSYAVLGGVDNGVAHAVAALVAVKLGLNGAPAGVPYGVSVLYVEVSAAHINGNVVVAVTRDAAQTSVLIEHISARSVGYE